MSENQNLPSKAVTFVENSKNEKIGDISATYVSIIGSCPSTCALKENGCYAQVGNPFFTVKRLDKAVIEQSLTPNDLADLEAEAIKNSFGGKKLRFKKDLRLHVSGDTTTKYGAKVISEAINDYKARGGGRVYTYTHAWRTVARKDWTQNISVLASVDDVSEIKKVRRKGYAPAIVVSEFKDHKAFNMPGTKTKFIPCPAQTKDVVCVDCGLCMNADDLYKRNYAVAFAAHGVRKNHIKKRLNVIG